MKSIVIYYSETGNTQKLAQAIASGMKCEAISITDINPKAVGDYDSVCFCPPVQGWQPAAKLLDFIEIMAPVISKYAASALTMHLGGSRNAARIIKHKLENKGYIVTGSYACLGWSRLIANFGPRILLRGHPDARELERTTTFGDNFSLNQQSSG